MKMQNISVTWDGKTLLSNNPRPYLLIKELNK